MIEFMNKTVYCIIFYITYAGFLAENILSIQVPLSLRSRFYIFGIPSRDLVLLLMLSIFIYKQDEILTIIRHNMVYIVVVLVSFFTLQGLLINGYSVIPIIRADLRVILWFLGGISFGFILIKTGYVRLNLRIIVIFTTSMLLVSTFYSEAAQLSRIIGIIYIYRIIEENIFIFSGILMPLLIILFNIEDKSFKTQLIPIYALLTLIYCNIYLSVTRSMSIIILLLLVLYILSLRGYKDVINVPNRPYKILKYGVYLIIFLGMYFIIDNLTLEGRFNRLSEFSIQSIINDPRFIEFQDFIEQSIQRNVLIVGQGFGGSINSFIQNMYATNTMHIGIVNIWMKMGIIPFIVIAFYFYIKYPYMFIKAIVSQSSYNSNQRIACTVVLPSLFPWFIALTMSGGFNEASFLFAGFSYYFYYEINKNGMLHILSADSVRGHESINTNEKILLKL